MAKKTLYFDGYCDYVLSAVAEHGKITDFNFEKKNSASVIGNIYKGRIENVLNGMNAAFVNCGLARNCYLSADDVFPDANKYDGNLTEIPDALNLKEGSEIMVQVVKAPVGNKGARVTAKPDIYALRFVCRGIAQNQRRRTEKEPDIFRGQTQT